MFSRISLQFFPHFFKWLQSYLTLYFVEIKSYVGTFFLQFLDINGKLRKYLEKNKSKDPEKKSQIQDPWKHVIYQQVNKREPKIRTTERAIFDTNFTSISILLNTISRSQNEQKLLVILSVDFRQEKSKQHTSLYDLYS